MNANDFIAAAKNHDWDVVEKAKQGPPDLASALEGALASMDETSRRVAAACIAEQSAPGSGEVLLRMTLDDSPQVAADAATALRGSAAPPRPDEVIAAIPSRQEPFVRSELFKLTARQRDASMLDEVRKVASIEGDEIAREDAEVACVALGGEMEKKAFLVRVASAPSDQALRVQEQLLTLGDLRYARALEPWLAREDTVMRLGGDRGPVQKMVRMCDMAVWTAHLLGVSLAAAPDHLDNFDVSTLDSTAVALRALPPV